MSRAARKPKLTWRDIPDSAHTRRFSRWPSPESLHPSELTILGYCLGVPESKAIIDSYGKPCLPIKIVEVLR